MRGRIQTILTLAILALLAVWIRLVPLELWSASDRSSRNVRDEIEKQVLRHIPNDRARAEQSLAIKSAIDRWMQENRPQIETQTAAMAQQVKEDLSYRTPDG